ncbi:MAG: SRPBCC domain-containing protein [Chitinophagaceae bacterium]|nr:SRPBCC domain-containing protein [Chitinophagaceae bacterium]
MNSKITWPAPFHPSISPVFVSNTIDINASPEKVWYWLTNATTWQEWYCNASKVKLMNQQGGSLQAGTIFRWRTFGANLRSEVKEFIPNERLAWDAKGIGILAYHAWLIIPTATGCTVLTEETQYGILCRLGKLFMPYRMYKYHQLWLEGLKRKAEES